MKKMATHQIALVIKCSHVPKMVEICGDLGLMRLQHVGLADRSRTGSFNFKLCGSLLSGWEWHVLGIFMEAKLR